MSSDNPWSLVFFDAPPERVLPWMAGFYRAEDITFRRNAPVRRWFTPRPKLRQGEALRANDIGHTVPVRFGAAVGAASITLVEGPDPFDIRDPDGMRMLPLGRIAQAAGVDVYRMGWRPDLMTLMLTRAEGRPRTITVWREGGRWHRHETGRPLAIEEPGAFGGPNPGVPFSDTVLCRYLDRIAPGLGPGAAIRDEDAFVIAGGWRGMGLGAFQREAKVLLDQKGPSLAAD